jgi:hypothetical protein
MKDDDREFRELYARLKAEDRAHTPPYRAPMRAEPRRRPWSPRIAVAAAIVLIALILARPDAPPPHAFQPDLRRSTWRSPTDFLLETPGSELLRTVPVVGSPHFWTPELPGRSPTAESTRS